MPVMKPITGNLFFVGLMGAGKTTLGRHIAKTLDRPFYDSDHEICKCSGVSISTIFEVEGEQGFRSRETAMLKKLAAMKNIVLSTGGGAVLREENRICLRNNGTVIYLHASCANFMIPAMRFTGKLRISLSNRGTAKKPSASCLIFCITGKGAVSGYRFSNTEAV